MKKFVLSLSSVSLFACNQQAAEAPATDGAFAALAYDGADYSDDATKLAHGERLSKVLGCAGCHNENFQGGNMTMSTADGTVISFQTGQPRFFAEQGVTYQVGDTIRVLGFYEGEQFIAGEITQTSTGSRVMLRDPNGRPLWAGPGNSSGAGSRNGGNGRGRNGTAGNGLENSGPQG